MPVTEIYYAKVMLLFLKKEIKRVCVLGNQHGLLQYMLLSSLEDIDHTFFLFVKTAIPEEITIKFGKNCAFIPMPSENNLKDNAFLNCLRLFYYYRIYYPLKFPFLLNSKLEFWGHDHVYNSHCFFRNHSFRLLEDGTLNYEPYKQYLPRHRFQIIKKIIAEKNHGEFLRYSGDENNCIKIYLTGLSDKGEVLKDPKTTIRSFSDMWKDSHIEKKAFINHIFGVSSSLIRESSKYKHILLTEPLSEEHLLSEEEKIKLYKELIFRINKEGVVIKPHPRDRTDYSLFIPNVFILKTYAPMQLLSLNGVRFETAYSIRSSALFDFPYRIKICVFGTEVHPVLFQKLPDWSSDKIKASITNVNVELFEL